MMHELNVVRPFGLRMLRVPRVRVSNFNNQFK